MTYAEYNEVIQHLLSVINALAPTGKDQVGAVLKLQEMEKDNFEDKQIVLGLISYLYDGLAYGNWPSASEGNLK